MLAPGRPFIDLGAAGIVIACSTETPHEPTVVEPERFIRHWRFWCGEVELAPTDGNGGPFPFDPPLSLALPLRAQADGAGRFRVTYEDAFYTHHGSAHALVTLTVDLTKRVIVYGARRLGVVTD
ncbi:MAG: hypothetical protein H0T42_24675 [Deltaproteobacteria bacterium]|nr:hypothetical protein [Deltaproteobacteria bacterium]